MESVGRHKSYGRIYPEDATNRSIRRISKEVLS